MIICCILGGLLILSIIFAIIFKGSIAGDFLVACSTISGLIVCIVGALLISIYTSLPSTNAANQVQYDEIIYELDHLDQYNVYKVQNDVNEWNEYLIKTQYGKRNAWVNWWYPEDIAHFNLLELDTSQSCPCCGRPLSQPVKVVESDSR